MQLTYAGDHRSFQILLRSSPHTRVIDRMATFEYSETGRCFTPCNNPEISQEFQDVREVDILTQKDLMRIPYNIHFVDTVKGCAEACEFIFLSNYEKPQHNQPG
eukprot:970293-Amorphochlora_amoeboformis.AAC.1